MTVRNGSDLLMASPIRNMIPNKETFGGASYGLAEVGYDIRLKQTVRFTRIIGEESIVHRLDETGDWLDGRFCLASAMEEFDMPPDLVGIVHDKSTWARKGLSVFNTVIEPGWRGFLTLELVFHGNQELVLPAGAGIAQVIFHELSVPALYRGKYQDQEDRPVGSILR